MTKPKITYNSISPVLLRRKNKLVLSSSLKSETKLTSSIIINTMSANLGSLGYGLSEELSLELEYYPLDYVTHIYDNLKKQLSILRGANKTFNPMYSGFPKSVMDKSEEELYVNALIHYITKAVPEPESVATFPFFEDVEYTILHLGDAEDEKKLFTNLLRSSLSDQDKKDVKYLLDTVDVSKSFPDSIPSKETSSFISSLLWETDSNLISKVIKTATDVLRLAISLSGGDESLSKKSKFKNFTRPERKRILSILDNCTNITEDMYRWKLYWIRLGEKLHPFEYSQFKKANEAFQVIRGNKGKYKTFNSKIEEAIEAKDIEKAATLLSKRPGEFARRLDHLLRINEDAKTVVTEFEKVANKVSTPVLVQVKDRLTRRQEKSTKDMRIFFPKGKITNAITAPNNLAEPLSSVHAKKIVNVCTSTLIDRFKSLPTLGKTYLDEELKNFIVPFSNRSASSALRTVTRGSKLKGSQKQFLRMFIWWTGKDVDLSAIFFDDKYKKKGHISYTHLKDNKYNCFHSGDITHAPEPDGACEFIDIDKHKLKEKGIRFVLCSVYSYSRITFNNIECFVGWMDRSKSQKGKTFEPKSVANKIGVSSNSLSVMPFVYDLEEDVVIWLDMAELKRTTSRVQNIESNLDLLTIALKSGIEMEKPNIYDLLELHIKARGEQVDNKDDADTIFTAEETPFQIEEIYSEYLNV